MSQYQREYQPAGHRRTIDRTDDRFGHRRHFGEMSGNWVWSPSSLRSRPAHNTGSAPVTITTSTSSSYPHPATQ